MGLFTRKIAVADVPVEAETRQVPLEVALSSPAAYGILGWGGLNYSGEAVSEATALTLSAVWRAGNLIAGTMASIPLQTFRTLDDGSREKVASFLDNPAGPLSVTEFEWKETVFLHLVLHGEAFLMHLYGGAGQLVGLHPIHPYSVSVERDASAPEGKIFRVSCYDNQQLVLDATQLTHVVGPSTDGLRGMGPLSYGRNSMGMSLAAERGAASQFRNGSRIPGVLSLQGEDVDQEDLDLITQDISSKVFGVENSGSIPILNKIVKFEAWAMTNEQAQYMESRKFQVEEIGRWFGVPAHLLGVIGAVSNWGTGIAEQNKNLQQYVLNPLALRLTARLSRLLPQPRFVEFNFAGLLAGSATEEITLINSQINNGLITGNEGRKLLNLEPLPGNDVLRIPSGVQLQSQLEANADAKAAEAEALVAENSTTPTDPAAIDAVGTEEGGR